MQEQASAVEELPSLQLDQLAGPALVASFFGILPGLLVATLRCLVLHLCYRHHHLEEDQSF